MDKDLKSKTFEDIEDIVVALGGKKYLAKYIFSFIHSKDVVDIDGISPVSKEFRANLISEGYYISRLVMVEKFVDPDSTVKYLFALGDGCRVESVLLTNGTGVKRRTLCISCQAGCRMGCVFCATAKLKFERDLTAGEIVDQVNYAVADSGKINNIVYMGMGEPMDNYDEMMRSVHILNHHAGNNIGQRHITVSTCGIVEGIDRFAQEHLQVRLAVSLHAANDEVREKIMAIGRKYPLADLMTALRRYQLETKRRVTLEYCMIKGLNDSDGDARAVVGLVKGLKTSVNLIEYNPHDGCDFQASGRERIAGFLDVLMKGGVETVVRYKRGQHIKAACGQLGATWLEK